jgi:hypothetical protein
MIREGWRVVGYTRGREGQRREIRREKEKG